MDPAEIWRSLPVITRGYVSLCVVTTAACALEVRKESKDAAIDLWWAHVPPFRFTACRCRLPLWPQIITPFNIYFNSKLIWQKHEFWRLLTNFFFFGNLGALADGGGAEPESSRGLAFLLGADASPRPATSRASVQASTFSSTCSSW